MHHFRGDLHDETQKLLKIQARSNEVSDLGERLDLPDIDLIVFFFLSGHLYFLRNRAILRNASFRLSKFNA